MGDEGPSGWQNRIIVPSKAYHQVGSRVPAELVSTPSMAGDTGLFHWAEPLKVLVPQHPPQIGANRWSAEWFLAVRPSQLGLVTRPTDIPLGPASWLAEADYFITHPWASVTGSVPDHGDLLGNAPTTRVFTTPREHHRWPSLPTIRPCRRGPPC